MHLPYSLDAVIFQDHNQKKMVKPLKVFFMVFIIQLAAETALADIPGYKAWPGVIAAYPGETVLLKWTLNTSLDNTDWSRISFHYLTQGGKSVIEFSKGGAISWGTSYNMRSNISMSNNRDIIGFRLEGVQQRDITAPYRCTVFISPNSHVNCMAEILLYDIPSIAIITPNQLSLTVGSNISMRCSSNSTSLPVDLRPGMNYNWTLYGGNMDSRHSISGNNSQVLTIMSLTAWDNNQTYMCVAQEKGSRYVKSVNFTLDVKYEPINQTINPSGNHTVTEQSELRFVCTAECNPLCRYVWQKGTDLVKTVADGSATLYFSSINRTDSGIYSCLATNNIGNNATASTFITVNYPPKPTLAILPDGDLVKGINITVVCAANSRPQSQMSWTNVTVGGSGLQETGSNSTHSWINITNIDILDSGTLECTANNNMSGPRRTQKHINIYGPARVAMKYPPDGQNGTSLGSDVNFTLTVIANPLPNATQWNWSFNSTNYTLITDNVKLIHMNETTVLSIVNVTKNNYGSYYIGAHNRYGGFNEENVVFILRRLGPPDGPSNLNVVRVTAVSVTVEWVVGFDGGLPQNFTILYIDTSSSEKHMETITPDESSHSNTVMRKKLKNGINPDSRYEIKVSAKNDKGNSGGASITAVTPGKPTFDKNDLQILMQETTAEVTFTVGGQFTHVIIENCVKGTITCMNATVNSTLPKERMKRQTQDGTELDVIIELADVTANEFSFRFFIYDGDDLVYLVSDSFERSKKQEINIGVIIGGALGGLIVAVLVILLILWRKGIFTNRGDKRQSNKTSSSQQIQRRAPGKSTSTGNPNLSESTFSNVAVQPGGKKNITKDDIPYEDTEVKSGILVTKFAAFVDQILQTKKPFEREYGSLPQDQQFEWTAALRDDDLKDKNRFKNILPYDKNRVELLTRQGYPLSDYINASYIKGYSTQDKYIATLGPMPETVDDFWRMVWEKDVPLIVMLTNCRELGGKKKCEQYWPVSVGAGPVFHSNIKINMIKEDIWLDYTIRTFTIKKKGEERTVYHCHFTSWPDHGVPDCGTALIAFRGIVMKKMVPNHYTIMHCSAGVGRTGTLIALDYLIKQGDKEKHVDVFACVKQLRMQRVHMIQTLAQYVFLHEALSEYFSAGPTNIPCVDFINTYTKITKTVHSGLTKILLEMKELDKLSPTIREADQDYPHEGVNFNKNRDPSIIPLLSSRVFLSSRVPDRNDYINAVYVSTLQRKDAFIVTQVPLEDTIIDFWRLIMEINSSTIVLLATDQQYKMMPKFIPISENQCITLNGITVRRIGETIKKRFTEMEIDISPASPMENVYMNAPHVVQSGEAASIQNKSMRLFCVNLAKNKPCVDPVSTLSLITEVNHWKDTGAQVPIVVVCWDGATYSGQFVASYSLVEMMSAEQEVDVFRAVKQIRDRRPQFINNMEQYKGLYEVAKHYIKRDNVYVNVI